MKKIGSYDGISGRLPRASSRDVGDGTARFPRRHKVEGKPCSGNILEADWIDVEIRK